MFTKEECTLLEGKNKELENAINKLEEERKALNRQQNALDQKLKEHQAQLEKKYDGYYTVT